MKRCSECGRPAKAFPRGAGQYKGKRARARKYKAVKDHDLCQQCFERLVDSDKAKALANRERKRSDTMQTKEKRPVMFGRVQMDHFRRITCLEWRPLKNHTRVSGPNGSGKSTFIAGIVAGITGKAGDDAVQRGADQAVIEYEILDRQTAELIYTARRVFKPDGKSDLKVFDAEGQKVKQPQTKLDEILPRAFFPQQWVSKRAIDKISDLLKAYDVKPPVAAVARILGREIAPKPDEGAHAYLNRLAADDTGLVFVERAAANREVVTKEKALDEFRPSLVFIEGEEKDISQLLIDRATLNAKADKRNAAKLELAKAQEGKATLLKNIENVRNGELNPTTRRMDEKKKRIEELEVALKKAKQELAIEQDNYVAVEKRIMAAEKKVSAWDEEVAAKAKHLETFEDPTSRIEAVEKSITEVETYRTAMIERRQRRETAERLKEELEEAKGEAALKTCQLEELRALKPALLAGTNLHELGLSIGDDELLLNGFSFEDAGSMAEKFRVAVRLFIRIDKSGLMFMDQSELFDEKTERMILEELDAYESVCVLAMVDRRANSLAWEFCDATELYGEKHEILTMDKTSGELVGVES